MTPGVTVLTICTSFSSLFFFFPYLLLILVCFFFFDLLFQTLRRPLAPFNPGTPTPVPLLQPQAPCSPLVPWDPLVVPPRHFCPDRPPQVLPGPPLRVFCTSGKASPPSHGVCKEPDFEHFKKGDSLLPPSSAAHFRSTLEKLLPPRLTFFFGILRIKSPPHCCPARSCPMVTCLFPLNSQGPDLQRTPWSSLLTQWPPFSHQVIVFQSSLDALGLPFFFFPWKSGRVLPSPAILFFLSSLQGY